MKACGFDDCARPQAGARRDLRGIRVLGGIGRDSRCGIGSFSLTRSGAKAQLEIHDSQNSCLGSEAEFDVRE